MIEQDDLTTNDARRLAAIARAKAEMWRMMAQELESLCGLRPARRAATAQSSTATPADIQRLIGQDGGAMRKAKIAEKLGAPLHEIEPLLTPEHGIEVTPQGWVKVLDNGSVTAEQRGVQS